jgi:ubiquinone/menaquinone biosynthesis C-methylase UbiE
MNQLWIQSIKDEKTRAMIAVLADAMLAPPRDILVVGCGTGIEAGQLARAFSANTIGIDVGQEFQFEHDVAAPAKLMTMDAQRLEFPPQSFDMVYCFHALEHMPDPVLALREMARVLRPGGLYLLGTPNKSRLLGYVGSAHSFATKLRWNLKDLSMRLQGNWRNDCGAHAGFTEGELRSMCHRAFGRAEVKSDQYYETLYRSKQKFVRALSLSGAKRFVYPCVYVVGTKA